MLTYIFSFLFLWYLPAKKPIVEGAIHFKASLISGPSKFIFYFSRNQSIRVDKVIKSKNGSNVQQSIVFQPTKKTVTIDYINKTYTQQDRKPPIYHNIKISSKGKEKINGYLCERVLVSLGDNMFNLNLWMASSILKKSTLKQFLNSLRLLGINKSIVEALDAQGVIGFPVKVTVGNLMSLELEKIVPKKINSTTFHIPNGFKKVSH